MTDDFIFLQNTNNLFIYDFICPNSSLEFSLIAGYSFIINMETFWE